MIIIKLKVLLGKIVHQWQTAKIKDTKLIKRNISKSNKKIRINSMMTMVRFKKPKYKIALLNKE